jgi:hypothetical protein
VAGTVFILWAGAFGMYMSPNLGAHEIVPVLPFCAVLAAWLEAHHLTSGLASYWESNITTVDSHGRVRLAAVTNGGTTAEPYESDLTWFNPAMYQANFIVADPWGPGTSPVSPSVVQARYGKPARVHHFENYTIMVYDYNLPTRITVRAGLWRGFRPG